MAINYYTFFLLQLGLSGCGFILFNFNTNKKKQKAKSKNKSKHFGADKIRASNLYYAHSPAKQTRSAVYSATSFLCLLFLRSLCCCRFCFNVSSTCCSLEFFAQPFGFFCCNCIAFTTRAVVAELSSRSVYFVLFLLFADCLYDLGVCAHCCRCC